MGGPPKRIGMPILGRCPRCKRSALFHAIPDEGEELDYNCYCRACGTKSRREVQEAQAQPGSPTTRRARTKTTAAGAPAPQPRPATRRRLVTRPVGGSRIGRAAPDYDADGPIAVKREIGWGDFLMASVVLKAAKLARPSNHTVIVTSSPRPGAMREWLRGIPWANEVTHTWPEGVPQDRRIDLQNRFQFDFGWWGGVNERVEVALGRAGVPRELWDAAARPDYCPEPESFERGAAWLCERGVPNGAKLIVLTARSLGAAGRRSLPADYFSALVGRLLTETDAWLLAPEAEPPPGVGAERLLTQKCNLNEMTDAVYRARLLLTTDTGPLHVGTCFGTPTVGWFSSSPPWARITHYPNAVGVFNASACERGLWPCARHGRPRCEEAKCLGGVPLDAIMELVQERLARPPVVKFIGPYPSDPAFATVAASVAAIEAEGRPARHIPTTPNQGWPEEGPGTIVVDEGIGPREVP